MAQALKTLEPPRFLQTSRIDAWWLQPLVTFVVFAGFIVYSTWAAFQGDHYHAGPYLSPFYSPEIFGTSEHALIHGAPAWWPSWLVFSPAFLILWAPGGFRLTCYYYRGAYYKAFWADPPSCAVGEPRSGYRGERKLPLVVQNIHRYFLYLALAFLVVLAWDAWKGLWFTDAAGIKRFGVGIGSLVLILNVILLGGYTFSCHSLRHLVGGRLRVLSRAPVRRAAYGCVSRLNTRHMVWAWCSLIWVAFSDVYIRLCSMGVWTDLRLF